VEVNGSDKLSSLLRYGNNNNGCNVFYIIALRDHNIA
jgi:hypothetical protein